MRLKFRSKLYRMSKGLYYIYVPKALYPNLDPRKKYLVIITDEEDENNAQE